MERKRIIVTGGAGFIGTHLCKKLLEIGNIVICVDNLSTGSFSNIKKLMNDDKFEFIKHDITKPFFKENIDEIYNLACPASPMQYQINPIKTIKTCTIGVINMLGLAKKNNAKILQASTSEIYGDPKEHPQKETYNGNVNTVGIRSCYDEGKRCAETLFMDYMREHSLKIRIARIFNTYGPYMAMDDGRVVSNFIIQALKNNDITVYGNGSQTRSFQYIDDLIEGLIMLMNLGENYIEPINLGNPFEIKVDELCDRIISLTDSKSKKIYKDLPSDDPRRRKPNIDLAKKILNWEPKVNLEKGLLNTINYFEKTLKLNHI